MSHYLAIDFGGTRTRAAIFDSAMQLIRRAETPTRVPDGQAAVIQRIIDLGRSLLSEEVNQVVPIRGIGVAAPGPLDAEKGLIIHAKTLPGWTNVPLASLLSAAFDDIPTFIQNDANLGAVAEYYLGAGQGADPMIYLTVSTGIGGGAIIDGKLFTGASALAIEPGHMRFTLPDGSHRRWEELASGTALADWARHYLQESGIDSLLRAEHVIDGKAVGAAAAAGDSLALRVVTDAGRWLGLGLVNLIHLFNPQAIVLGGSVIQLGALLLDPAREVIRANILDDLFWTDSLLRTAAIPEDVCLVGAARHCANQLSQPT